MDIRGYNMNSAKYEFINFCEDQYEDFNAKGVLKNIGASMVPVWGSVTGYRKATELANAEKWGKGAKLAAQIGGIASPLMNYSPLIPFAIADIGIMGHKHGNLVEKLEKEGIKKGYHGDDLKEWVKEQRRKLRKQE
jgi:hypothetical protein